MLLMLCSPFSLTCLLFWLCSLFRVLGGLLSAYDLSGDEVFLEKARDLADKLLPAWNTPSGIPYNRINLAYGNTNNPRWTRVCLGLTMYFSYFPIANFIHIKHFYIKKHSFIIVVYCQGLKHGDLDTV
jgi:hypothetical protein